MPGSLIGEVRAPAAVYRPADVRRPVETPSLDCRRVQVDDGGSAKGPSGLRGSSFYRKEKKKNNRRDYGREFLQHAGETPENTRGWRKEHIARAD